MCDGSPDCGGGEEEEEELCSDRECHHGLRCHQSPQCLHSPHKQLCTGLTMQLIGSQNYTSNREQENIYKHGTLGLDSRLDCADGSDEAFCHGPTFTGCLLLTDLGLRISPCSECLCNLTRSVNREALILIPSAGANCWCIKIRGHFIFRTIIYRTSLFVSFE